MDDQLQFADLSEENEYQTILPHGHQAVAKLVHKVHKLMLHAGTIISALRQRVWLTRETCGRQKMCDLYKTAGWTRCTEDGTITLRDI